MKPRANAKAPLAWILFLANGFFWQFPRQVYAQYYPYDYGYDHSSEYSEEPNYIRKTTHYYMTCNCSWGTVPDSRTQNKLVLVGGSKVRQSENYPMIVGIQQRKCVVCGASILTEYHVLTAAHCVSNEEIVPFLTLAVGVRKRCRKKHGPGQYIKIRTVYIHPDYDPDIFYNDIAIILTRRRIVFNDRVGPTCIQTQPFKSTTTIPVLVLGWGKRSPHQEICRKKVPEGFVKDSKKKMCTNRKSKYACKRDSGGPLFVVDHRVNRLTQIGLVSKAQGCGRPNKPGVNTALRPFVTWMKWTIDHSMKDHFPRIYENYHPSMCYVNSVIRYH